MENQVAIVTGASSGIGAATVKLLSNMGYAVAVNFNNNERQAIDIVNEINNAGGKAIAVQADVSSEQQIIHMFEYVDSQLGGVTALVNNAGVNGGVGLVADIDIKLLQHVFAVNVYSVFICCREALKRMRSIGKGAIVNVSSEAAKFGGNCLTHYAAAKAAINTFTIGFAKEVAADNIRVNAVSPGIINTKMHSKNSTKRMQQLQQSLPMGRMGKPSEVANTIAWLLSDTASYISGTVVSVTGGR